MPPPESEKLRRQPASSTCANIGAAGDGKTLDTDAVNRAIEAAAAAGGGVVTVSRRNLSLLLHPSQEQCPSASRSRARPSSPPISPKPGETTGYNGGTYDAAEPKTAWDAYQDYGHNHWHNSLIWGEDIHDISITGPGLIYGKGLSFGAGRHRRAAIIPSIMPSRQAWATKPSRSRTAATSCFRDFSILKGGHFGLLLTGVDNLTIDNLKIDTDRDGIDIDCCQNVRVSNCTVNSPWDDGICPKSSYALGYARATRNVTIANCLVTGCYQLGTVLDGTWKKISAGRTRPYGTGRIKCGTESNGGFINITISELRLRGLPRLRAGIRRWRAARRHHHHQHHHARSRLRPALPPSRLAPARPKRHHQSRHAQARAHQTISTATTRPCARDPSCRGIPELSA